MAELTPIIFVSYSHDSKEHKELVLQLCQRLREDGFDARLDRYLNGSPKEGWPRWMMNQLDECDHVIVVCTEEYYKRFRGTSPRGKGSNFEGVLITQEIYDQHSRTKKFMPVTFRPADLTFIPEPLRSGNYYVFNSFENYTAFVEVLHGVAGILPRPIGEARKREIGFGKVMVFPDEPTDSLTAPSLKNSDAHFPPKLLSTEFSQSVPEPTIGSQFENRVTPALQHSTSNDGEPEEPAVEKRAHPVVVQLTVVGLISLLIISVYFLWRIFGQQELPTP